MKGLKTIYICSECEYQSPKWMGKCPSCGAWNSFVEDVIDTSPKPQGAHFTPTRSANNPPVLFDELALPNYMRSDTGMGELDRVLGGGLVYGSVVLLSGEPGIGKSTLLMQICTALGESRKVLYISGEESQGQLKLRAKRIGLHGKNIYILTETNIEAILNECDKLSPDVIIVDSIQTIYNERLTSTPGSVTQVKETALAFMNKAKTDGASVILVGHVNKEGGIAGPKVLEHMVDAVLYFEGERAQSYRIIRAIKNRYGSTNEIGVFEMTDKGLLEVENPSEMLLSGRPKNTSGNCAACVIEGTRPIIAEVQALVTQTVFPSPRRNASGIDHNRMSLILAVLEKKLGLKFSVNDAYLNVIGGLYLDEPAADMAISLALISSITDRIVPDELIAIGELGLAGECRAVSQIESRIKEASRLGFTKIVLPRRNFEKLTSVPDGIELIPIDGIYEVLKTLKPKD